MPQLIRIHQARGIPDWNTYALAATIEEARHNGRNPDMPGWLRPEYDQAWRDLQELALAEFPAASDDELVNGIMAVLALSKGRIVLGRIAANFTDDERREMLREAGWG